MVKVEYHSDLKEVQSDTPLARLLSEEMQHAPFDRLAWWQLLEKHCDLAPMLVIAREESAAAILPLTSREAHMSALANWYTFRFRSVLIGGDHLLPALARDLAKRAHRVTLTGVPDEDKSATLLQSAFAKAGWLVMREPCDINHVLPVSGRSYDEYIAARPGRLRTTLKRKTGKVETEILSCFDEHAWQAYEDIYAESWKPEEGSPDFLRAFARQEGEAGRLRLGVARAGGEAIAAQMWTVEGKTAFIHKLAHREAAKPLSPGSVLTAALFRQVIDVDRVEMVDFGTGDDPYKRDWMEETRLRYRLDMFRLSRPQNWPVLMRIALRRLAANLKRG